MSVIVEKVCPASYGEKSGVLAGDELVKINSHEIFDVLDYRFYQNDVKITAEIINSKGKEKEKTIKKREGDEIGLLFDTYLMDKQRACKNKCILA